MVGGGVGVGGVVGNTLVGNELVETGKLLPLLLMPVLLFAFGELLERLALRARSSSNRIRICIGLPKSSACHVLEASDPSGPITFS